MTYTNSSLVSYTKISPCKTVNRNHIIDRITIHCVVGQLSVETIGSCFDHTSAQASSNYGVGVDGRVGMYVEEKDRSWCTSSSANDHRAITIECASDKTSPYAVNDKVYQSLITLVADICKRNGKKKITWLADKDKSINYSPASDEMLMTVHRWFANKSCPGDYLYNRHAEIASKVNALLGNTSVPVTTNTTSNQNSNNTNSSPTKTISASKAAQEKNTTLAGTYIVINAPSGLNCRNGAGQQFSSLCLIPNGTRVQNYGYYTISNGIKWLYIQFTLNGVTYTGFSSIQYLQKT